MAITMSAKLENAFDVAFWFADTALNENEYLQPQKLQRLLFLAQANYSIAFNGSLLMPAFFVADEMGPLEPNIYMAFSRGRPEIDARLFLPHDVENFLDGIWNQFGQYSTDQLNKITMGSLAYKQAFKKGHRSEITLDAMKNSFSRAKNISRSNQNEMPKILKTQSGRPVSVKAWVPGKKNIEDTSIS
jgi:uncharacterized phage-associated protein